MNKNQIFFSNSTKDGIYQYTGYDELIKNEKYLINYNTDLINKMTYYSGKNTNILEFGAGIGTLALEWKKQTQIEPKCVEIDIKLSKIIRDKGLVCYKSLEDINEKFDTVYSSNVIEHIEDDVNSLKQLHKIMNNNGTLILFVPAFMCLYSEFDRIVEHYRRYEKKELIEKVKSSGFIILKCHYADSIGFFGFLYLKYFGYKRDKNLGSSSGFLFYDKYIYPLSKFLDKIGFKYLFGKNLFLIAKKIE